jgi:hypothetical protein
LGSSIRNLRLIAVKLVLGEDRRSDSSNFGETLCDFFSRATKPSSPTRSTAGCKAVCTDGLAADLDIV